LFFIPNKLAPCHPPGPLSLQFFDTTPPSTDPHLPFSGSLFFRDLLTSACSVCSVVVPLPVFCLPFVLGVPWLPVFRFSVFRVFWVFRGCPSSGFLSSVCSGCSVVARLRGLLPRDSRGSTVAMANISD
jgi:hypothetical protein